MYKYIFIYIIFYRCWYYAAREEIRIRGPFIYTRFYTSSRFANLNKFKNKLPVRPCAAILFITVINPMEGNNIYYFIYCVFINSQIFIRKNE